MRGRAGGGELACVFVYVHVVCCEVVRAGDVALHAMPRVTAKTCC